jgi:hypothetical protein
MTSSEIGYFGFTDGGCINNGKKNAKASFCSIAVDGTNKYIISGLVQPNQYYLDETKITFNEDGKIINMAEMSYTENPYIKIDNTIKINPSSNRGELLGLVHCFIQLVCMGLNSNMSNNYVENRFGTIKRDIMKKSKPCLPSDIVPKLYCLIKVILSHIHRRMHPKIIFLFYIIFYEIRMRFAK